MVVLCDDLPGEGGRERQASSAAKTIAAMRSEMVVRGELSMTSVPNRPGAIWMAALMEGARAESAAAPREAAARRRSQ